MMEITPQMRGQGNAAKPTGGYNTKVNEDDINEGGDVIDQNCKQATCKRCLNFC